MPRASHSVHPLIRPAAEVLDEVYRVDRPTDEWLRGLSSIRVFDPEGPPLAWILKNEDERWSLVAHDDGPGLAPMIGLRDGQGRGRRCDWKRIRPAPMCSPRRARARSSPC